MNSIDSKSKRDPPINFHYTQFKFDFDEKLIPLIIGKEGAHLKRITELSNTEYIWWNNDKKIIEIWGREWRLPVAISLLKSHIKFMENKFNEKDIIETD